METGPGETGTRETGNKGNRTRKPDQEMGQGPGKITLREYGFWGL